MKIWRVAILLAWAIAPALAYSQVDPTAGAYGLTFNYDRAGLSVPHWQIKITPHFPAQYTGKPSQGLDPGIVFFAISDAGYDHLYDLLTRSHGMQPCETKSKGIANMGQKVIDLTPEGQPASHCTFNYTDNKALGEAADFLIAVANSVQTGIELDRLHRYDRLGLDAKLAMLQNEVKEHRARELGAIRATLESLRKDEALMDRVRTRAQILLDLADTSK